MKWALFVLIAALGVAQVTWRVSESLAAGIDWSIGALWGAAFMLALLLVSGKLEKWGKRDD